MSSNLERIFKVDGKQVLLTGASGFLGGDMARTFLEVGARVVLLGRSERVVGLVKELSREFGRDRVAAYQADFYDRARLEAVLREAADAHAFDVLVNNAFDFSRKTGFNAPDGRLEMSTFGQWEAAFESGIYWAVLATQIVGAGMKERGHGSIINVSTMYALVSPNPELYEGTTIFNPPSYGVVKAGLAAFTRYTAAFWGPNGVRCNAIAPGPIPNVGGASDNSVGAGDPIVERLKQRTLLKRVGRPDDLRGLLIYLASDASSFMTGQVLAVDGGWTVT